MRNIFSGCPSRFLTVLSLFFCGIMAAGAADFPLRAQYEVVGVHPISTQKLASGFKQYVIVDARSDYEYNTLHIKGARSIPLSSRDFSARVGKLAQAAHGKTIVFYCNGVTCSKSYRATAEAIQSGIHNVRVYDAGIFAWANAHPEDTVLLGEPLKSADRLISKKDFHAHTLNPEALFKQTDADPKAIIIDIRDAQQRAGVSLFRMRDHHIPLDNNRLKKWVDLARSEHRAMYFVDATGKQVQWLQYFLESEGLTHYWFMKGGVRAFYKDVQAH